jgi:ribosomal protein L11 methyltransferase
VISIDSQHTEWVCQWLQAQGALAVTYQSADHQPIYEPLPDTAPLWAQVKLTALFSNDIPLLRLQSQLESFCQNQTPNRCLDRLTFNSIHIKTLTPTDWERPQALPAAPLCFENALWIYPYHYPGEPTQHPYFYLSPGLAFGTGQHPTTALCLQALARHIPKRLIPNEPFHVLDYGCGSGILSLAAIRLGATQVVAVDLDPQALNATQDNAQRNQILPHHIQTYTPHGFDQIPAREEGTFDLCVANILANTLIELAPKLIRRLKPTGTIVLTGILETQVASVKQAYLHAIHSIHPKVPGREIIPIETHMQGEWVILMLNLSSYHPKLKLMDGFIRDQPI